MQDNLRRPVLAAFAAVFLVTSAMYVLAFMMPRSTSPAESLAIVTTRVEGEARIGAETDSVVDEKEDVPAAVPTRVASDPRWAFVLLGYGGGSHDGSYLTDSIMVVIADPSQKTLAMLSVPRDSWVPLVFDGKTAAYNKVNTAYAFATDRSSYPNRLPRYQGSHGAGTLVRDTIARLLGIPISNYFALDFTGFRQMIDTVGGIDVNVPGSFSALYPANDNPAIDPSWMTVSFAKGRDHMNGERAIQFARAREAINNPSEGSDFARSRRQRIIIEAFKNQVLQPGGLLRLPQLLGIASNHVDTDYTLPDVAQLGSLLLGWKDVKTYQTALTLDNYLEENSGPSGTYVLVPRTRDRTWTQIRAFAKRLWQDPERAIDVAATKITVVNQTGVAGAGSKLSDNLAKLGYRVGPPESGTKREESRLVDRTSGQGDAVAAMLAMDLGTHWSRVVEQPVGNTSELRLELGAMDVAVADISILPDPEAPSSAIGLLERPWQPAPEEAPSNTPTPALRGTSRTTTPGANTTPMRLSPTVSTTPTRTTTPHATPSGASAPRATVAATSTPSPSSTARSSPPNTSTPSSTPTSPRPTPTSTPRAAATARPAATTTPTGNR